MATTGSVAAALEQRVELQVPPAGPFMLFLLAAATGQRAAPRRVRAGAPTTQQTQGTENSTTRGSFDVGLEMQHSHEHDLCWN